MPVKYFLISFAASAVIFAALNVVASQPLISPLAVEELRTEYQTNPVGIDIRRPRLSWQLRSDQRGVLQSAFQLRVGRNESDLKDGINLLWDSGKVASEESVQRVYSGPALQSGRRYYWQVRVWDSRNVSGWSAPAYWEMGLLIPSDWQAKWIEPNLPENPLQPGPAPMLRGTFKVNAGVRDARAYVTSHGLYEMYLNGQCVGDQIFTPGWTSYNKRLQYQTYDVTGLLQPGENAIGVVLGDGWYRKFSTSGPNLYGDRLGLLLQIKVSYSDGHVETVISDQNWRAATGPILMSSIYLGETYDARLEKSGWTMPSYNDADWSSVTLASYSKDILVASPAPPVRRIEELRPIKIIKTPAGDKVVDIGQNMVGWVRLRVQGPKGTTVTLRHGEVLDKQGNFYTENLREAKQTVRYTLKGTGLEVFEPHFTFQGFRYIAVEGYPGELTTDSLTGVVIHSDMRQSSEFETSNPLVNQLQHNILWGQKGNFLDVPTDCPQRDERVGWTGDAQVFSGTAAFNMEVVGFFTKWLKDLAVDQYENGKVPYFIPNVSTKGSGGSAAWADAAVIIPWNIYLSYGDSRILEEQYASMAKWVEYERQQAGEDYIWNDESQIGDWLAFATTRPNYPGATTGKDLIATAFFAHSTDLLQRIALILGKYDDAVRYRRLLANIKAAFRREFVTETGRVGENTQTAYVLALQFDLLPDELRPVAAKRLADDVRKRKHLTTGFVGTPYLCHVLSRFGYLDEAYMLLNREEYPSWLDPVRKGATTIWERWDGIKPDGTFQDKSMNSFNHYALGSIGEWMYRVMAGIEIDPSASGYKHVLIQPQPGGGYRYVRASHQTLYGKLSSAWELKDSKFQLTIAVPANTTATVRLPRARLAQVRESSQPLSNAEGIADVRQADDVVVLKVGSGEYRFSYPMGAEQTKSMDRRR